MNSVMSYIQADECRKKAVDDGQEQEHSRAKNIAQKQDIAPDENRENEGGLGDHSAISMFTDIFTVKIGVDSSSNFRIKIGDFLFVEGDLRKITPLFSDC